MNKYYVYEYLRKNSLPYYIGKGTGQRAYEKRRKHKPNDLSRIRIVTDNLTEQEAWDLEIELIAKYGREDLGTGILKNLTDGGEGGSKSLTTRKKLSDAMKGRIPWNKGLDKSDLRVLKNANSRSLVRYSEETKNNFRKPKSEQGKINMSIGQKGKTYPLIGCSQCDRQIPTNAMHSHMKTHERKT